MTIHSKTTRLALAAVMAVGLLPAVAGAQTIDVPYQGWLDRDDQPCTGSYDMQFMLYDENSTLLTDPPIELLAVPVEAGSFSVVLPIPEVLAYENDQLFLGVSVKHTDDPDYTDLVNMQKIYPSVYAARNAPGSAFWVDEHLEFPAQTGEKVVFYSTASGYWAMQIQPYTLQIHTQAPGADPTMALKSDGKVGIGTTAPERKLHVAGDMQLDGNLYMGTADIPIQFARYDLSAEGGDVYYNTHVSSYAWSAGITGYRILDTDVDEGYVPYLVILYMYEYQETWWIRAELRSDNPEAWWVDVIFVRTQLSDRLTFGNGNWNLGAESSQP